MAGRLPYSIGMVSGSGHSQKDLYLKKASICVVKDTPLQDVYLFYQIYGKRSLGTEVNTANTCSSIPCMLKAVGGLCQSGLFPYEQHLGSTICLRSIIVNTYLGFGT